MSWSPELAATVALSGALGALARDALDRAVSAWLPRARLPVGILAVNVLGSFLLGIVVTVAALDDQGRLVAGGGFLGAFTTFSTFAVQTVRVACADAARNVILQLGGCLAAVLLGGLAGGVLS